MQITQSPSDFAMKHARQYTSMFLHYHTAAAMNFFIVVKVTNLKLFSNKIVPDKTAGAIADMNVYTGFARIMKESTTEYYNIRIAPGLEGT